MIDVCLINLRKPYLKQPEAQQPMGLLYLASALEDAGATVRLKNYAAFSEKQMFADFPQASLYGITATSLEIPEANRTAKAIKKKYPKAKIVIGGPGTIAADHIDLSAINTVVVGEGEDVIVDLWNDVKRGRDIDKTIKPDPVNIDNRFPARHLLKYQGGNVFAYNYNYHKGGSTVILSSRGCPYKCAFCSAPKLSCKVRFRKPEDIRTEVQRVIEEYGIRQFRFSDDLFTASRGHVERVCNAIGDLDIVWRISCRVKPLYRETLDLMYKAGCRELSFGIESFDDEVLKGLKKGTTARDNVDALYMAKAASFTTRVLFMIRTPFQTPETIIKNLYYIERVPFNIIACTAFVPIPGSDIWENPDDYNIEILDKDLDKYNFYSFQGGKRRSIEKIIKIKDRDIDEFHNESEFFLDSLEKTGKINKG